MISLGCRGTCKHIASGTAFFPINDATIRLLRCINGFDAEHALAFAAFQTVRAKRAPICETATGPSWNPLIALSIDCHGKG
jgi:hypothetical protein